MKNYGFLLLLFQLSLLGNDSDDVRFRRAKIFRNDIQKLMDDAVEKHPKDKRLEEIMVDFGELDETLQAFNNHDEDFASLLDVSRRLHGKLRKNYQVDRRKTHNALNWLKLIFPDDFRTI